MKQRGLTLIELVLCIAGGAAIALTIVLLVEPFGNVMFTFWRRGGSSEAQAAMARMLQEIERVKSPADITASTATRFTFVDIQNQTVDFQLTGSNLLRGNDVLTRNVQGLALEYLDKNGNAAATRDAIRVVRVTLVITSGNQTIGLQSAALIRNGVT